MALSGAGGVWVRVGLLEQAERHYALALAKGDPPAEEDRKALAETRDALAGWRRFPPPAIGGIAGP